MYLIDLFIWIFTPPKMFIVDLLCLFIGPLAGSLLYLVIMDLYKIRILKKKIYNTGYKFNQLYNKGLFIGFVFGCWRFMLGEPVIPYYLKKMNYI